jgi:hypothetical protein
MLLVALYAFIVLPNKFVWMEVQSARVFEDGEIRPFNKTLKDRCGRLLITVTQIVPRWYLYDNGSRTVAAVENETELHDLGTLFIAQSRLITLGRPIPVSVKEAENSTVLEFVSLVNARVRVVVPSKSLRSR